jgi:hypothetical protein
MMDIKTKGEQLRTPALSVHVHLFTPPRLNIAN